MSQRAQLSSVDTYNRCYCFRQSGLVVWKYTSQGVVEVRLAEVSWVNLLVYVPVLWNTVSRFACVSSTAVVLLCLSWLAPQNSQLLRNVKWKCWWKIVMLQQGLHTHLEEEEYLIEKCLSFKNILNSKGKWDSLSFDESRGNDTIFFYCITNRILKRYNDAKNM